MEQLTASQKELLVSLADFTNGEYFWNHAIWFKIKTAEFLFKDKILDFKDVLHLIKIGAIVNAESSVCFLDGDKYAKYQIDIMTAKEIIRPKRHIEVALDNLALECQIICDGFAERGEISSSCLRPEEIRKFIKVDSENCQVTFDIQSDPIKSVGINGVQCLDILKYSFHLLTSLNNSHRCKENEKSLDLILEAINWQEIRTEEREKRGVEGFNKD
jgi:hypothetical protein